MVDQLIFSLKEVSEQVIPILSAVVLILIILLLNKCIAFIGECTNRMKQLESTVQGVDKSIEKIQEPLNTAVKVSHGIDKAYDSTENALKSAATYVVSSIENLQSKSSKSDTHCNDSDVENN